MLKSGTPDRVLLDRSARTHRAYCKPALLMRGGKTVK